MKNPTNTKAFWATCLLSLLMFLITCWSAIYQDTTPYWIQSTGYFMLTYICLYEFNKKIQDLNIYMIGLAVIIGRIILQVIAMCTDFSGCLGSMMIAISCIIATLLALVCYKSKQSYSFILSYVILSLFNSAIAGLWTNFLSK